MSLVVKLGYDDFLNVAIEKCKCYNSMKWSFHSLQIPASSQQKISLFIIHYAKPLREAIWCDALGCILLLLQQWLCITHYDYWLLRRKSCVYVVSLSWHIICFSRFIFTRILSDSHTIFILIYLIFFLAFSQQKKTLLFLLLGAHSRGFR